MFNTVFSSLVEATLTSCPSIDSRKDFGARDASVFEVLELFAIEVFDRNLGRAFSGQAVVSAVWFGFHFTSIPSLWIAD